MKNRGLKSRLGYYTEKLTALTLASLLHQSSYKLTNQKLIFELEKQTKQYYKEKLSSFKDKQSEIEISKLHAKLLAQKIFDETKLDKKYSYNVKLTGESNKYDSSADLIIEGKYKNNTTSVSFSLKSYRSWIVNYFNSTLISFIKRLFFPEVQGNSKTFNSNLVKHIEKSSFVNIFEEKLPEVIKIANEYRIVKHFYKKSEETAEDASSFATQYMNDKFRDGLSRYQYISDYIVYVFNSLYPKMKDKIDKNFKEILDIDNGLNVYLSVIGKNGDSQIISSNTNKHFKEYIQGMMGNFDLKANRIDVNGFEILAYSKGKLIKRLRASLKENGKINLWIDFSSFLD